MLKKVFISAVQGSPSLWSISPAEHICPAPPPAGYFCMFTCYASGCHNCVALETGTTGPRGVTGILITCIVSWLICACLVLRDASRNTAWFYLYTQTYPEVLFPCLYTEQKVFCNSYNTIQYSLWPCLGKALVGRTR